MAVEKEIEILTTSSSDSLALAMRDVEDIGEAVAEMLKGSFKDRIVANLISAQFEFCQNPSNHNGIFLNLSKLAASLSGVNKAQQQIFIQDGISLSNGANRSRSFK